MMQIDSRYDDTEPCVHGRAGGTHRRARQRAQLKTVLAAVLLFPGPWAAAQAVDSRFAEPAPGTLTVKIVIDGHFEHPGKYPGEKFEGTVHREVSGSTYLDMVTVGPGAPFPAGEPGKVYAVGSDQPAPRNAVQDAAAAIEKCNGDQQCMMAIAMQMTGGPAGSTPAFMNQYVSWTTFGEEGRGCFDGTALIRESYKKVSLDAYEGGGGLATLTWTVNGEGQVPLPGSFVDLCGSQVLLDTQAGTYGLRLELNPELEVRSTAPNEAEPRTVRVVSGGSMMIRLQKVPAEGTTLAGSARFPGVFTMQDGSKVDATVTWTFTPGH
jgi:hypothetical protein